MNESPHCPGLKPTEPAGIGKSATFTRRKVLQSVAAGLGAAAASALAVTISAPARALPNGMIDVLSYGVAGDGKKDDHDAIQNIVSTYGGHQPIHFPAGRYRIGTTGAKGTNRIAMPSGTHLSFADGAVVEVNAEDNQLGRAIFFAGGTDGPKTPLPANADVGAQAVALPQGLSAEFAVGDIIGIESTGSAGDYADAGPWYVREFHSVAAIIANTIYLDSPLEYPYAVTDSAVIWKVNTVDNITIDGAVFECGPGVTAGTDGTYPIRLSKVKDILLRNILIRDMIGGIAIHDCYRGQIRDCTIDGTPRYGDAYGYGVHIGGSSAWITVDNLHGSNNRHLFTTLSDDRGGVFWGGPMHLRINSGIGYGAADGYSIWDTHEFGRHIEFNNCVALDGGKFVSGFQMRAQDIVMNNCQAQRNGLRAVVLTARSKRVHIRGGDFGYAGTQGIAAAGESNRISEAYVHDCAGAGIALINSKDLLIQNCTSVNNLYGLQDAGAAKPENGPQRASVNARIVDSVIPHSEKQKISIMDLSSTAVVENLQCLGFSTAGGMWNSAVPGWGVQNGARYSMLTSNGWITNSPTTTPR